jgi:hypothetical protein
MEREVFAPSTPARRRLTMALMTVLAGLAVLPVAARADTLPDGRAYELVTPGLNGVRVQPGDQFFTQATSSGDGLAFVATDALDGGSSSGVYNAMVAGRGTTGWSVTPEAIPFSAPEAGYLGTEVIAMSSDLSQVLVLTDQPLTAGAAPGYNLFLGNNASGTYTAITDASADSSSNNLSDIGASADFSHIFFNPDIRQLTTDKVNYHNGSNLYQWAGGQLSIVNVLPSGQLSKQPATLITGSPDNLSAVSADGGDVLFQDQNPSGIDPLYLRVNGSSTVQADLTQRSPADPNQQQSSTAVGITPDGSQVLFTSHSELTGTANTGGGSSPTDAGNDLYDYDVSTGVLTDLTPDKTSADSATGADVQAVIGASDDASYVYFVATGDLAAGATSGQDNLYVEHDGTPTYISPAGGLEDSAAYTTPDGQSIAFESTDSLTGYDNTDQTTGTPDTEVFVYNATSGTLACASCRADGVAPTGSSTIPGGGSSNGVNSPARVLSDDGTRAFFDSTDQVVPGATDGLQNVYEYENGAVSLISPGTGTSPATLVDASSSGNDVFFDSYDDVIPPLDSSLESAIWDARVGGGFPITSTTEGVCTATVQCRDTGTTGTGTPTIATDSSTGQISSHGGHAVFAVTSHALHGSTLTLRVRVRAAGRLTASGRGVRTAQRRVRHSETVTLSLRLTPVAQATLSHHHRLRLAIRVRFKRGSGGSRTITVHVTAKRKGSR